MRISLIVAIVAILIFNFGFPVLKQIGKLATSCSAKTLCSAHYLSKRDPSKLDLALECSNPLVPFVISNSINTTNNVVTSKLLGGLVTTKAKYHNNILGCSIITENSPNFDLTYLRKGADETKDWPIGDKVVIENNEKNNKLAQNMDKFFPKKDDWNTRAILIAQNGKILYERYLEGFSASTSFLGWSMTKSLTAALIGIRSLEDKRLDVNKNVLDFVPEWKQANDNRSEIVLDDLLRMASGLEWAEVYGIFKSDVVPILYRDASSSKWAVNKPLAYKPKSHWYYSSGTTNILTYILRNSINNDKDYWTYPTRKLFDKLGMSSAVMETDAEGNFVGSSFSYATARDWAKFAQLYLNDGVWDGERILPDNWVSYTRKPTPTSHHLYGAQFWLGGPKEDGPKHRILDEKTEWLKDLPNDVYFLHGYAHQLVMVIPSRNIIAVRLGYTPKDLHFPEGEFIKSVLSSLD